MKKQRTTIERVERQSAGFIAEQVAKLKESFPEVITEGKIDFAKLRGTLGDEVDDRPERYSFNWAGKRDAIRLLQTPSRATLVPAPMKPIGDLQEVFDVYHGFVYDNNLALHSGGSGELRRLPIRSLAAFSNPVP